MIPQDEMRQANASYAFAQNRMELLPNYYRWIRRSIGAVLNGRVAEIGVGAGYFLPHYISEADAIVAIDHDRSLLARIEERFRSEKLSVHWADLADPRALRGLGQIDTAIALDVLEHFEDDSALIARVAAQLRVGGRFVVKVPAQPHLYGETDRVSGHYRRYDRGALTRAMRASGLAPESLKDFNRAGALVYALKRSKRTTFSGTFSPSSLRSINRAIPLVAVLDRALPVPGLSLVGVFRKT